MYSSRKMEGQGSMAGTSFEYLKRWVGVQASRGPIYVDVEQGDDEVGIGGVDLGALASEKQVGTFRVRGTHRSDKTGCKSDIFGQCRIMDAV